MRRVLCRVVVLAWLAIGCSGSELISLTAPWDDTESVVVLFSEAGGAFLDDSAAFAPGEPVIVVAPAKAEAAHVFTFPGETQAPSGRLLYDCGVRLEAVGSLGEVPAPSGRWKMNLPDGALVPDQGPAVPLFFQRCGAAVDPCAPLDLAAPDLAILSEEATTLWGRPAVVSDERALLFGAVRTGTTPHARVFDADRATGTTEARVLPSNARYRHVYDGRLGPAQDLYLMVGTATQFELRRFDLDLQPLPSPELLWDRPEHESVRVFVGTDGTVLALADERGVYQVLSATAAIPRTDIPEPVHELHIHDESFIVVYDRTSIHVRSQTTWTEEIRVPAIERAGDLESIAGGPAAAMIVGELDVVRIRDETRTWEKIGGPFGAMGGSGRLRSVAALSQGRFIAVGESGLISLYTGAAWCAYPQATDHTVVALAVSPSGRTALARAEDVRDPDHVVQELLWLEVPPP